MGPRPALFNQDDLIELRTGKGIHRLIPGITGWAQINGRDELPIPVKVEFDEYYLKNNPQITQITQINSRKKAPQYDFPNLPQYHLPELRGRHGLTPVRFSEPTGQAQTFVRATPVK